ncbi:MAG TPA: glycosyl transferase family protein [Allosphingosinicella sp.]
MVGLEPLFAGLDFVMREAALFAATSFLVLGAGDVLVDLLWLALVVRRGVAGDRLIRASDLAGAGQPGTIAIFVPAWDEAEVIEPMLRHALLRLRHEDFVIYVGCYPNDPATIAAVARVGDPRVRLVVGPLPGPTTKADCLNRIWAAMVLDERLKRRRVRAIVLHDAEDVVDPDELFVFDVLIGRFDMVQLPVFPLVDENSRWIAGHYADEFAESHGKEMVVRQAIGAALPSAGVGCAFAREALEDIAAARGGGPFDAGSITEDYELGLRLRALGGRAAFVRLPGRDGRSLVVTKEYFPATLEAAVAQKARWMTGIALAGWDRLGWSGSLAERWMRIRDRQSLLAALALGAGYVAGLIWTMLTLRQIFLGIDADPVAPLLALFLQINLAMLGWRLMVRFAFVTHAYGWREGLRSLARIFVGNIIAMLAARRAILGYIAMRRTGSARWDKTAHAFPVEMPAE